MKQALNYYRTVADYDGVIQAVRHELTGLSIDNYTQWYYSSCADFYSRKSAWLSIGGRFNKYSDDRTELFLRVRSLPSRLYVMRKMRDPKNALPLSFNHKAKALTIKFERGYERAFDKNLYLAQRLRDLAEELSTMAVGFRAARAGETWLSRLGFEFNPEKHRNDRPSQFGGILAKIEHFRQVLTQFDQETSPTAAPTEHVSSAVVSDPASKQPLTLRQIALLYIYRDKGMPANVNAIAQEHGHTSGRKLKQLYNDLQHHTDRVGMDKKQKRNGMIKAISAVIPYLTDAALEMATGELLTLREDSR